MLLADSEATSAVLAQELALGSSVVGLIGVWLAKRRKGDSGKSDAEKLWDEANQMRDLYRGMLAQSQADVAELRVQVATLRDGAVAMQIEADRLRAKYAEQEKQA